MKLRSNARPLALSVAVAAATIALAPASVFSAPKYWDLNGGTAALQAGDGAWDTGTTALWSTAAAGTALTTWADNDSALFQGVGTNNVNLSGGTVQATSITSNTGTSTAGSITNISNGTVRINITGITVNQTLNAVSAPLTFASSAAVELNSATALAVGAGQTLIFNGAVTEVTGPRVVTKSNGGALFFNGTTQFTGGLTISGGMVQFGTASTIPTAGNVLINAAGVLSASGPVAGPNTVNTWLSSGRVNAASAGAIGIVGNYSTDISLAGFDNLHLGAASAGTYSGLLTPGANGYRFGGFSTLTVSSNLTAPATLTANNVAGGATILTGNNTYTGLTTVSAGAVLRAGSPNALGSTAAGVVVADTGRLELIGTVSINESISISGQGNNSQGALHNISGDNTWAGPIVIANSTSRVGVATGTLTLTGVIDDGADSFKLTVRNNGSAGSVIIANSNNTYGGGTDVVVGTLRLGVDNALPTTGVVTLSNTSTTGAALDLNGRSQTVGNVTAIAANNRTTRVVNNNATAGALTIHSAVDVNTGTTAFPVLFGDTNQNNFSLTKAGSGILTLAGTSTYTGGTTITGGSITTGLTGALGGGNVTVQSSATSLIIPTGVANVIANTATLSLAGGGTPNTPDAGYVSLASGIDEIVAGLVLNGLPQGTGTYGATGSGADNISDEYFSGGGLLRVVPEPTSTAALVVGIALLLGRRRSVRFQR